MDETIRQARRWVIKIGSALLTNDGAGLNHAGLKDWAEQIARLRESGREVVLVSSGAVAEGMTRLGWKQRPKAIHELQAAAAVGQMGLIQAYESRFREHGLHSAQILLTHDDMTNRKRYLNARSSLRTLLDLGVIPVVNENDTVAIDEIRFGDNDTLAALVANLVDADALLLLTDQPGLFDADPRMNDQAQLIPQANADDDALLDFAGESASQLSLGGMRTKVMAARRAARSGTHTIIAAGREPGVIRRVADGERLGTRIVASRKPVTARKQWIASHMRPKGEIVVDKGAAKALAECGSLLPVGVISASGDFVRGDAVRCMDSEGQPLACGLINYDLEEVRKIIGKPSRQIEAILGYVDEPELIHRDNMALY
ncbi:MAG TPA: glutamate 5-kinase [Gammaproteobacteria bacterium]|nr:glutamate 5-kinase [Gammaproteobacteria bacterium]